MNKTVGLAILGLGLVGCGRAEVRPFPVISTTSGASASRIAASWISDDATTSRVITPSYDALRAQVAVPLVTAFEDRSFGAGDSVSSSTALGRAKTEVTEANDEVSVFNGTLPGGTYTLTVNNKARTYTYSAKVLVDAVITQEGAFPTADYIGYMRRYAIISTFSGKINGKNAEGSGQSVIIEFQPTIQRGSIRSRTDFDLSVGNMADAAVFVTYISAKSAGVNSTVTQSGRQWNQIAQSALFAQDVLSNPVESNEAMWAFMQSAPSLTLSTYGYQESVSTTVQFKNGQIVSN